MSLYVHFNSESTCSMKGSHGDVPLQVQAHATHTPGVKASPSALLYFLPIPPATEAGAGKAVLPAAEVGTHVLLPLPAGRDPQASLTMVAVFRRPDPPPPPASNPPPPVPTPALPEPPADPAEGSAPHLSPAPPPAAARTWRRLTSPPPGPPAR